MEKKILESKKEMRKHLASLTPTEKIRILEKLRDRSVALAATRLRRKPAGDSTADSDEKEK